jgi:saccharopine dehydrogenase-like NADP-dependent oxidoreductase
MRVLRESGFFSQDEVDVNGIKIKPIDFTSKLLFPMWELKEGDEEFTVMKVIVEGEKDKKKIRYTYNLLDRHDKNKYSLNGKNNGYTATTMVRLLAKECSIKKDFVRLSISGKNLNAWISF